MSDPIKLTSTVSLSAFPYFLCFPRDRAARPSDSIGSDSKHKNGKIGRNIGENSVDCAYLCQKLVTERLIYGQPLYKVDEFA